MVKRGRKKGVYGQRTNEIKYDIENKSVGESYKDIAKKYNVSKQYISFVLHRDLQN